MHSEQWKILHAGELAFFARVAASISHEIKNHLAIINEQNGLMGDLLAMAVKSGGIPATRMDAVVNDIAKQITLTDTIVRRFNTFAHTADKAAASVDVGDALVLLAQIGTRLARLKEKRLIVDKTPEHVVVRTNHFALLHLLYVCLNMLLEGAAKGDEVQLGLTVAEEEVRILMTARGGLESERVSGQDHVFLLLLEMLGAGFAVDIDGARLILTIPKDRQAQGK